MDGSRVRKGPSLPWAERERAAFYRRVVAFFQTYDLSVTAGSPTAALDVLLRHPETIAGKKPENDMAGATVNSVITHQLPGHCRAAKPRGGAALLQAAALREQLVGLDRLLPIDPRPGTVPPSS